MCRSLIICTLIFLLSSVICAPKNAPIGLILNKDQEVYATVVQYALWNQQRLKSQPTILAEVIKETIDTNDAVQVVQAVCRLLNRGVLAIITETTEVSYPILTDYSNAFKLPLVAIELPEVAQDQQAIGLRVKTSRAVLDILRSHQWKDIVYLYDNEYGSEKVHKMFLLGYRAMKLRLVGMKRVSTSVEANHYLRKLDNSTHDGQFHVILDTDPALARDIIVRHVHDAHVNKANFCFLFSQPTLEDYWLSRPAEFGAVNVSGFLAFPPDLKTAKNFKEDWQSLSPQVWAGAGTNDLNMTMYYFYDAALVLYEAIAALDQVSSSWNRGNGITYTETRNCREQPPTPLTNGGRLSFTLKRTDLKSGVTGRVNFHGTYGERNNYILQTVEISKGNYKVTGYWSDSGRLWISTNDDATLPTAASLLGKRTIRVTSKLSPPYMMLRENSSAAMGNNRFEGYCKDLLDLLEEELNVDYVLEMVFDDTYGRYHEDKGKWSGMIGEVIGGRADIAVADLTITGRRQRVVAFTDPYQMISFSIIMKDPRSIASTTSPFFFLSAFSRNVWICILVALLLVMAEFYLVSRMTGGPDSIESATGIWGRKFSVSSAVWFVLGSLLFQNAGIYPRSVSPRLLSSGWWIFTLVMVSLYVASITTQMQLDNSNDEDSPQLVQLHAPSLEAIIEESLSRGWPTIGTIRRGHVFSFIEKSTIPIYAKLSSHLRSNPSALVDSFEEGIARVRNSRGDYIFMIEAHAGEYLSGQAPCDTVLTRDTASFAGYGIATTLDSSISSEINDALSRIKRKGYLGHLHRKWWIDSNKCTNFQRKGHEGTLHSISGLLYVLLVGSAAVSVIAVAQFYWKDSTRENRRRRLSFEDINMGPNLPMPAAELLEPPSIVREPVEEGGGIIHGWSESRNLVPTSFRSEDEGNASVNL